MVPALYQILLVVHVAAAAVWFGGTLFLAGSARRALAQGRQIARAWLAEAARQGRLHRAAAVLVLLSGIALALLFPGGFARLPVRYHIALTLTLVWVAISLTLVRPTLGRMAAMAAEVTDAPLTQAGALTKRLAALMGVQHLLFMINLVLMLWRLG